ncbi:hypothetical protein EZ449_14380 [Pedobacter frigidisoli]|uniref:Glycosyl transferase family 2 n=1 Tax=Pedobacter frigidisoli TaxID=2530455 RepID=A0A4V2MMP9_9SPHI|nr:hypothetical protein [Pedobacter frigidisoli]TCD07716.1 hypothetical protein EZ449_14380 [Pedobacter frigidisoli]
MIGFIVAFKPRQNSKDWTNDCVLLNRTLRSICNQTSNNFAVYLIYHDLPPELYHHPNLKFIKFPYPFCKIENLADVYEKHLNDEKMYVNGYDQGKKILFGANEAINDGCSHIMSVDADDLISNRIVSFVENQKSKSDVWFVSKGYIFLTNQSLLLRKPSKMYAINGSTYIIPREYIPIPNFDSNGIESFGFFSAHNYLFYNLRERGISLRPLPFYAIVYVAHTSNWTNIAQTFDHLSLKNIFLKILRYQPKFRYLSKRFNF